jgi:hypothetical protein
MMAQIKTTLAAIKDHGPCTDGWKKLLNSLDKTKADKKPLSLLTILEHNGLDDALWALRAVDGYSKAMRLYAVFCARYVLPIFEKELTAAGDAAWDAAGDAARDAARKNFEAEFIRLCKLEGDYGKVGVE